MRKIGVNELDNEIGMNFFGRFVMYESAVSLYFSTSQ
jgi:hypothetical protein